jgi:hypothetical protein
MDLMSKFFKTRSKTLNMMMKTVLWFLLFVIFVRILVSSWTKFVQSCVNYLFRCFVQVWCERYVSVGIWQMATFM